MLDLINGLPVHVLVVHGVVVLTPLAALGAILIAVKPAWRYTYGPLLTAIALVDTILAPIAASSGEELEKRVGDPGTHAEIGGLLIWFLIPLTLLIAALAFAARRPDSSVGQKLSGGTAKALAGLTVVAAIAATGFVVWVGDTGAGAAWDGKIQGTSTSSSSSGG